PMWLAVAVAAVNCAGGVALVPASPRRHGVVLDGGLLARRGALPGGARRDVFCQQDLSGNRIGN
ncbi:hypothetical protein, partial [Collinsella aerofaciens]